MTRESGRMTEAEFRDLALGLGGDPAGWPGGARAELSARMADPAAAPSARAAVDEAAALDAALRDLAAAPVAPEALLRRMEADAAAAFGAPRPRPAARSAVRRARPLQRIAAPAAFAASALLGVMLGYSGAGPLSAGFAELTAGTWSEAQETAFLQTELMAQADLPPEEELR